MALEVRQIQAGIQATQRAMEYASIPRQRGPKRAHRGGLKAFLGIHVSSPLEERGRGIRRTRPGSNVSYASACSLAGRCTWLLHRGLTPTSMVTSMSISIPIRMWMWKWMGMWTWTPWSRCRRPPVCIYIIHSSTWGAPAVRLEDEGASVDSRTNTRVLLGGTNCMRVRSYIAGLRGHRGLFCFAGVEEE